MAANNFMKAQIKSLLGQLALLMLLLGCNKGDVVVGHGSMSYNLLEVFSNDPSALALTKAVGRGDVKEVNSQISIGANVNAVGKFDITPLWWAAWTENYEGFVALLDRGANPNDQRAEGYPIMYLVADMKDGRFLEAALKHGGDPNLRDKLSGQTPLFPAVQNGRKAQIDILLTAKADVNAQMPSSHWTLPMLAIASRADYQVAYQLLLAGANPALKTSNGQTLADIIELKSINASNNDDPWRAKVLEILKSKGVTASKPAAK